MKKIKKIKSKMNTGYRTKKIVEGALVLSHAHQGSWDPRSSQVQEAWVSHRH